MWPTFANSREFFDHFFESELALVKGLDDYTKNDLRNKKDFIYNRWMRSTKKQICDIRVAISDQIKDDIRIQEMQDDRPDLY